ncbi:MAG: hypothetical protein M3O93_08890 [Chloroflexota bacterium]|nr:hypothetical protein [Chloroflexota bacterium]
MLTDDDLAKLYQGLGLPMEKWRVVTPPEMAEYFRYYFRAFPSPGSNFPGAKDGEELLHDPIRALRKQEVEDTDEHIIGPDEWPHISTMVVNHDKTLNRFVMGVTVVASTNPSTVGMTFVKAEAPGDEDFMRQ